MSAFVAGSKTGLRNRWDALLRRRHLWWRRLPLIGSRLVRDEMIQRYQKVVGRFPQLDPPRTFNEHIIHRVIHDRDPRLKILCDKIAVRRFISERVGPDHLVPLLGMWKRATAIEWDRLPEKFVLKPSHSSGFVAFIASPADRDIPRLTAEAESWLGHDYFDLSCEWGYRGIPRSVLAEPLLEPLGGPLIEVQTFCFHGKLALIRFLFGRKWVPGRRDAWFDPTGRRVAVAAHLAGAPYVLANGLRQRLIALSEPLAQGLSQVRVDIYLIDDTLKVGELTPYTYGGRGRWKTPQVDEWLGRMWQPDCDPSIFPDYEG